MDCFVITKKQIKTGVIIDVQAVGLMEQVEDGDIDNKILAVFPDEIIEINDDVKAALSGFVLHVFDHIPGKKLNVGRFWVKN